jgi:hypothetical protein
MHAACFDAWPDRAAFERAVREVELWQRAFGGLRDEAIRREAEILDAQRKQRLQIHATRHPEILERVRTRGARCPHCGAHTKAFRERAGEWPYLVCPNCHRSSDAEDLDVT